MKRTIYSLFYILTFLFVLCSCSKQPTSDSLTLPNALKVIVKEDHRAPVVLVEVWYKVGSSYEPSGLTGISHVLEHLMFEGSRHYPKDAYTKLVSANGGSLNAATSFDYTFYYNELAANKLALAFALEADRMEHLNITPASFAKEIKIVKEERRMRTDDNPMGLTAERFNAAAFISSPYHHAPIGWMSDLNSMIFNDVKQWYKQWYAPNNAIVVVVGDVHPELVFKLAKKYFGNIPRRTLPVLKSPADQSQLGSKEIIVNVPAQLPLIKMGYNVPTLPNAKQACEPYALEILSAVFAGDKSSRLQQEFVRKLQIASNVEVDYDLDSRLPRLFVFNAIPTQGQSLEKLKQAIISAVQQVQNNLISEDELNRIKNQVIADKIFAKDSLETQANEIGSFEVLGLGADEIEHYVKAIEQVTPEQVQAVAKKYLVNNRLTIAYLIPKKMGSKEQ
ncbi:MAG: M16 family metallopeptidase [Gammaproteobacteria bacterium]